MEPDFLALLGVGGSSSCISKALLLLSLPDLVSVVCNEELSLVQC